MCPSEPVRLLGWPTHLSLSLFFSWNRTLYTVLISQPRFLLRGVKVWGWQKFHRHLDRGILRRNERKFRLSWLPRESKKSAESEVRSMQSTNYSDDFPRKWACACVWVEREKEREREEPSPICEECQTRGESAICPHTHTQSLSLSLSLSLSSLPCSECSPFPDNLSSVVQFIYTPGTHGHIAEKIHITWRGDKTALDLFNKGSECLVQYYTF